MRNLTQLNHTDFQVNGLTSAKTVVSGLVAGLAGTIAMDVFGFVLFAVLQAPASLSFSVIGDSAAAFLSLVHVQIMGGAGLGAFLHYLIGLVLGVIFCEVVPRVNSLRANSRKQGIGLGILYVEIMSLPMLVTAALVLNMTTAQTAQWFGISIVMHLVYGAVLGNIVHHWRPLLDPAA